MTDRYSAGGSADVLSDFDSVVTGEEKAILKEIVSRETMHCPNLQRRGGSFYYCRLSKMAASEIESQELLEVCRTKLGVAEISTYCMGDFEKCHYLKGELNR